VLRRRSEERLQRRERRTCYRSLQPTWCHERSCARSLSGFPGFHPSTGATGSLLRATLGVTFRIELSTSAPAGRCRHRWPRMAGRLVPPCQLWPCPVPLREQRPPWLGSALAVALSAEASRRDAAADVPCRGVEPGLGEPKTTPTPPEPLPPGSTKDPGFPSSRRLPSKGPEAKHGTPEGAQHPDQVGAIPRLGRLGPPLDMHSRQSARPVCVRFFTGGDAPHAAYRLLQQIRATNTPLEIPDLDLVVGTMPHRSSDSTPARASSCERRADRVFSAQGSRSTDTQHPPMATARPTDLPRPDEPGHLLSQICTTSRPGEPHGVTVAVTAPPKRTNLPDAPHLRAACL